MIDLRWAGNCADSRCEQMTKFEDTELTDQKAPSESLGSSQMGALIRAFDWASSPLGPVERWPRALRSSVRFALGSGFPKLLLWGPELIQIYNDAFRPVLGSTKHPRSLGQRAHECWPEVWNILGPMFDKVMKTGESIAAEDRLFLLNRHDYLEATYLTISYSPIPDDAGDVGGILGTCYETTPKILGQRRLRMLSELAALVGCQTKGIQETFANLEKIFSESRDLLPFALVYRMDQDRRHARLLAVSGLERGHPAARVVVPLGQPVEAAWPFADVLESGRAARVDGLTARFAGLPARPGSEPPRCAMVVPMVALGKSEIGAFLIAGANPYRELDEDYRLFLELTGNLVSAITASSPAHTLEEQRAEARTELNREQSVAIKGNEALIQAMMEDSPTVMFIKDLGGRYLHVNRRFEEEFGVSRDLILGRIDLDIFPRAQAEAFRANDALVLQHGAPAQFEEVARYLDGEHTSIVSKFPLLDAAGKAYALGGIAVGITERKRSEEALRESEERFRIIFNQSAVGIAFVDLEGRPFLTNAACQQMLGRTAEELRQMVFTEFTHPEDRDKDMVLYRELLTGERDSYQIEKRYFRKDGQCVWAGLSVTLIREPSGQPKFALSIVKDITERKRAEEALQESEERLRLMVESVQDYAIFLLDPSGAVASWNKGAERIKGYAAAEILGQHFSSFYTPEDLAEGLPAKVLAEALASGHCEREGWRIKKDGSRFWGNVDVSAVRDASGHLRGFVKVTRDMTERREAEETMRANQARLTQLSHQLLEVEETERRRLARELHDQLGQSLALLQINLQAAQEEVGPGNPARILQEQIAIVEGMHEQVRNLALNLRPSLLDDLGLVPALRWHLDRLAQSSGLKFRFKAAGSVTRCSAEIETSCFRVAQEALSNVLHHAQARNVSVNLAQAAGELILRIRDDGTGFDPMTARQRGAAGRGLGLLMMEERMKLVGGDLSILSRSAKGTTLCARFPLTSPAPSASRSSPSEQGLA